MRSLLLLLLLVAGLAFAEEEADQSNAHPDAPLQTPGQVLSAAIFCNYEGLAIRCPEPFTNTVRDPAALQAYQNSPCGLQNPIVIRPVRKFLFPAACLNYCHNDESLCGAENEISFRLRDLIANRQNADGSWFSDVAISNWCLMGLMSMGDSPTTGIHRKNVRRARDWLADRVQSAPERLTLYELTLTIRSFSELLSLAEKDSRAPAVIRSCLQNLYDRQYADGGWADRQELRWERGQLVWRDNLNRRIFLTCLAHIAIMDARCAGIAEPDHPYASRAVAFLKDNIPPCGAPASDPQALLMEGLILSVLSSDARRDRNYTPRCLASAAVFGNRLESVLAGNPPDGLLILYFSRMGFYNAFGRSFLWPEMKYSGLSYLHRTFFQNNQLIPPDTGAEFPYPQ